MRFGADNELGVVVDAQGQPRIVAVADVGEDAILVRDERRDDPRLAFLLYHLARGPSVPTPIGVFRAVERPHYGALLIHQVMAAAERQGLGNLTELLASGPTWQA